ncbi:arylamine N-acetyltransferase family protein [Metabacillus sp. 113a]|uniref:arylamine N-acetyltransferase family protein n=1 Tax=Metabacillus sp. 113a TaxID=3404706 RepID=UPI003CF6685A
MSLHSALLSRIGIKTREPIHFKDLGDILRAFSRTVPFENFRILNKTSGRLDQASLVSKLVSGQEGGVCYELNSLLYYFLIESGMNAAIVPGTVYHHGNGAWSLSGTHAAVIAEADEGAYLLDGGFGINVAQTPIPMSGETVQTDTGQFRVANKPTAEGTHLLEMKLAHEAGVWKTGYAFNAEKSLRLSDLHSMQQKIQEHPGSPFNKDPLAAKRTATGFITLTKDSFTVTSGTKSEKQAISETEFVEIAEREFGLKTGPFL